MVGNCKMGGPKLWIVVEYVSSLSHTAAVGNYVYMEGDRINHCAFIILRKEIISYACHGGHSKGNSDI